MIQPLLRQDFRNVRIATEGDKLIVVLTNVRISEMSRAVGRAARTIVALAPIETREIRITYEVADLPFATYEFVDVQRLQRYFNGQIGRGELAEYVNVTYAQPASGDIAAEKDDVIVALDKERQSTFFDQTEGDIYSFRTESSSLSRFKISPKVGLYLNDPSGAFRYDTVAWAALTPYAKEYDVPWLYGVAALANVGRVAERRHWLSDTVAGSFIGYGVGSLMWSLNKEREKGDPQVAVKGQSVDVSWVY